jgi:hypothetical protein
MILSHWVLYGGFPPELPVYNYRCRLLSIVIQALVGGIPT